MKELDRLAVSSGIPVSFLMENAGEAVAKKAAAVLGNRKGRRVAVFCGKGNNGGDGFVAARKLKEGGFDVEVYLLCRRTAVKKDAGDNLRRFIEGGGSVKEVISDADIAPLKKNLNCSLIIDAIMGTGFSGSVSGVLKKLIEFLNSSEVPILALDVPSGLDSTTGKVGTIAARAKWTISFALPKKGFYAESGPDYAGEIRITNIGFPEELLRKAIEFENKICAHSR